MGFEGRAITKDTIQLKARHVATRGCYEVTLKATIRVTVSVP